MPPWYYRLVHPKSGLSESQRDTVSRWATAKLHGLALITLNGVVLKPARLLFAFLLCAISGPALAQVDPWEFEVYPAQTVGREWSSSKR